MDAGIYSLVLNSDVISLAHLPLDPPLLLINFNYNSHCSLSEDLCAWKLRVVSADGIGVVTWGGLGLLTFLGYHTPTWIHLVQAPRVFCLCHQVPDTINVLFSEAERQHTLKPITTFSSLHEANKGAWLKFAACNYHWPWAPSPTILISFQCL